MKMRIGFVISSLILLFCMSFLSVEQERKMNAEEGIPVESVTIFIATDIHYLSPALTDHGEYFTQMVEQADGKVTTYTEELTEAFIQEMIEKSPDVLLLSGDLTFNGAEKSHRDLAKGLQHIVDAGITVLAIPGNHDLNNPMSASFRGDSYQLEPSITGEQFTDIYGTFGYEQAVTKDEKSLSYVAQVTPTLQILMLDVNGAETPGFVSQNTFHWVEKQLKEAAKEGSRILTVSHQNVLPHNSVFTNGFMIENGDVLKSIYEKYGVICNLSGHMHIQHIAENGSGLTEIVTSSLAVSPNQYGVLRLAENQADYHTEQTDVSAYARKNGLADPNLLEFEDYSREFFRENSLRQTKGELEHCERQNEMSEFFAEVNSNYFAGRLDQINRENPWISEWKQNQGFAETYLRSILEEEPKDHTKGQFAF
ncbi:MAG: metallophosphoesterase [Clostridium sp.]|nr:metallophosphoesterase [Clostridium sp.]